MKFVFEETPKTADDDLFEHLSTVEGPANFEEGYKRLIDKCEVRII